MIGLLLMGLLVRIYCFLLCHNLRRLQQLGILNVIEVMHLPPEHVYPVYLAAASDRYASIGFHELRKWHNPNSSLFLC